MTNAVFYEHIENIKQKKELITREFVLNCDKKQFEYLKDCLWGRPLDRIVLLCMRWGGNITDRKRFELTDVDTSTWD